MSAPLKYDPAFLAAVMIGAQAVVEHPADRSRFAYTVAETYIAELARADAVLREPFAYQLALVNAFTRVGWRLGSGTRRKLGDITSRILQAEQERRANAAAH